MPALPAHFPALSSSTSQAEDKADETPTPLGSKVKGIPKTTAAEIDTLKEHLKNIKISERGRG